MRTSHLAGLALATATSAAAASATAGAPPDARAADAPAAVPDPTAPSAAEPDAAPADVTRAEEQPGALVPSSRRAAPLTMATGPLQPTPPGPSWPPPPPHSWHEGVAFGVGFGAAFVHGVDPGFFARIDAGAYDIQSRRRGLIGGMLVGFEGWRARGPGDEVNWGGSLPLVIYGGLQSDAMFAVLGGGFDVFLVDRVEGDTGFGFFAPEAAADIGLDLEGVRFLVDGRAGYHWQLGATDRSTLRIGGVIQLTTD